MSTYTLQLEKIAKKRPIVIEGFPGFGLVSTIVTEFLLDHLSFKKIGTVFFEHMPATVAVHAGKLIEPVSIYYNPEYNLVIIHAIAAPTGQEWVAADAVLEICKELNAAQLISIEGVGSPTAKEQMAVLYYTSDSGMEKKFRAAKIDKLTEGIVVGVTSALLMKVDLPFSCLFAESQTKLPDAKAAANVITLLDKILGLNVDPKPLLKQAEAFEKKLKSLLEQAQQVHREQKQKKISYVG